MPISAIKEWIPSATQIQKRRKVSLRDLVRLVYPQPQRVSPELALESAPGVWQVVLRTANESPVITERPARKYLWVRRTSRRAYNLHMSKMQDTLGDIKAMPALVIFTSLVGIAVCLSLFIR